MNYRLLAWGTGAGFLLLIATIQPWNHTGPAVTARDIDGGHHPTQRAPDEHGDARIVISPSPAITLATNATPSIPPAAEVDLDPDAVYIALFSADPQGRGGALDRIAQRPEFFSSQDRFNARLEEMTADYEPAVAEQAALVLVQLMGSRARAEDETPSTNMAWEAARTTLPETTTSTAPDFVSDEAADRLTNASPSLPDTHQIAVPGPTRMTMAADEAVTP